MMHTKDYDFSFSGLKTAVLYHHKKQTKQTKRSKKYIQQMATEIQQAIIDVLIKKTMKAVKDYEARTLILGGGVSANKELRKQFKNALIGITQRVELFIPPTSLSTDNAVMTAITAYFHQNKKVAPSKVATIRANANLRISK